MYVPVVRKILKILNLKILNLIRINFTTSFLKSTEEEKFLVILRGRKERDFFFHTHPPLFGVHEMKIIIMLLRREVQRGEGSYSGEALSSRIDAWMEDLCAQGK